MRAGPAPAALVEIWLSPRASHRFRRAAGEVIQGISEAWFAFFLDGTRVMAGICYPRIGAAAIRFPVMHIETERESVVLRLGSTQGVWYGMGSGTAAVDPPALRAFSRPAPPPRSR